jgi:acetyl-CoA carboxylase beta subunit
MTAVVVGGSTGTSEVTVAGTSVAGARAALQNVESAQAVTTKRFMIGSMGAVHR